MKDATSTIGAKFTPTPLRRSRLATGSVTRTMRREIFRRPCVLPGTTTVSKTSRSVTYARQMPAKASSQDQGMLVVQRGAKAQIARAYGIRRQRGGARSRSCSALPVAQALEQVLVLPRLRAPVLVGRGHVRAQLRRRVPRPARVVQHGAC